MSSPREGHSPRTSVNTASPPRLDSLPDSLLPYEGPVPLSPRSGISSYSPSTEEYTALHHTSPASSASVDFENADEDAAYLRASSAETAGPVFDSTIRVPDLVGISEDADGNPVDHYVVPGEHGPETHLLNIRHIFSGPTDDIALSELFDN